MARVVLAALLLLVAVPDAGAAPRPVEFGVSAEGASGQVRAPERFDLVGLRWASGQRAPHVHVRVRRAGGAFGPWRELASVGHASDPLWTGGARVVEYRLSHRVRGLRLHFVRTERFQPEAEPVRAAQSQPSIRSRPAWGGGQCKPRARPAYDEVKVALVHHTVTSSSYSRDDVPAMILSICRYHRNSNGWNDIGYNFLVDRFGRLWEGRRGGVDRAVMGAHATSFNAQSTGIANLGTFTSSGQSDAALRAMARLIRWKLPLHGEPTAGQARVFTTPGRTVTLNRISGHRDVNATSCPGDALYAQLPDLRERVGAQPPAPAGPPPELVVQPPAAKVERGRSLGVTGTIAPSKRSVTVVVETRRDGAWRRTQRIPVEVSDGAFDAGLVFDDPGRYRLFAHFDGDGRNGPVKSALHELRVTSG